MDLNALARLLESATCRKCHGEGQRVYSDTTCGRGGAGGQMITGGPCIDCRALGISVPFVRAITAAAPALLHIAQAAEAWRDAERARPLCECGGTTACEDWCPVFTWEMGLSDAKQKLRAAVGAMREGGK